MYTAYTYITKYIRNARQRALTIMPIRKESHELHIHPLQIFDYFSRRLS